jgi:mitochondrial fission protein ELM1
MGRDAMSGTLAVHDGRAGNARQATALAQALDADAVECQLHPGVLARWLAPRTWPLLQAPFGPGFLAARAAPPGLAIGCGRQAALATRLLRSGGSRVVQILDPRIAARHWDLLVVPAHDRLRGDNVIPMLGSLHPVDDLWLAQARHASPLLAALPSPHTVLLVGGPSRHAPLSGEGFDALLQALARRAREEGGSVSAIASRRTPTPWRERLARMPVDLPGIRWRDARDGDNPYAGLLGHADRIVCTPDSVNMLSEAAATLAPVFVWARGMARGRLRRFLDALLDSGRVREFDHLLSPFHAEPLRETARVADEIRRRFDAPSTG